MNFKLFLRCLVFLAILFVVAYLCVNNTQAVDFSFPMALQKSVRQPAWMIYFFVFAVGVLGGAVLTAGSGGSARRGASKDK